MQYIITLKLVFTIGILYLNINISQAQRYINLDADSIFGPDTIREFEKPVVRYSLRNAGPDSICKTDSFLIAFAFNPFFGPEVRIPNTQKWAKEYFTFCFNKDLGKGDTVIFNWKCPSTFKVPYTKIGYVGIVAWFNVVDTHLVKTDPLYLKGLTRKEDVVFYFPTSGLTVAEQDNSILAVNPVENGILHFKSPLEKSSIIRLYDALGRLQLEIMDDSKDSSIDLKPFNLADGFYFLQIEKEEKLYRQKIVISN